MDRKVWSHIVLSNLEEMFTEGTQALDSVKSGLDVWLNRKRAHFARL